MSGSVPRLFDLDVLALRRERALRLAAAGEGEARKDFIAEFAVQDIVDRLDFIRRRFRRVLVLGPADPALMGALGQRLEAGGDVLVIDLVAPRHDGSDAPRWLAERMRQDGGAFDLVVSPAVLHLVDDLPGVLAVVRQAMVADGLLIANVIGGQSLHELRTSLIEAEAAASGGASARVHPMIDVRSFGALLQRTGFALPVADGDVIDVSYATSLDLMADLRAMARTNILHERSRRFLTRAVLAEAEARYRAQFPAGNGRLRATFEIVTGTGWVPHESQQKPLRPGSATTRLSDALKPPQNRGGCGDE